MPFTTIFTYVYHIRTHNCFVTTFIKNPHISENMTIWPRGSTKETRWVPIRGPVTAPCEIFLPPINMHRHTLILQSPTKHLKPSHTSLFDLLPSVILAYTDIWIYVLEHRNKFKHVIFHFKSICNPLI